MKSKSLSIIFFVLIFAACSSTDTFAPTDAVVSIATVTPTSTLLPTLTLVPASVQAQTTPTALYIPIELSPEDDEAYQKALSDIPVYRQGDIQIELQDGNPPLKGYQVKYDQINHDFLFGGISDNFDITQLLLAGLNSWSVQMSWYWMQPDHGKYDLDFTNYWLGIDELNRKEYLLPIFGRSECLAKRRNNDSM